MIEAQNLTKDYGKKRAVDHISFTVAPGTVTGFLGPNGAGKSTTMRLILGLDNPTEGSVTVGGKPYTSYSDPIRQVGALLDARGIHPGRSAYSHLNCIAATHGISSKRVKEVLQITGLTSVSGKRAGKFSLGMGQRLGIAAALLGDPKVLLFDEPVNGLDPDGVIWVRDLCRQLAAEGRTVFISSHLMSEMSQTADHLVLIGRGRIITSGPINEIIDSATQTTVNIATSEIARLLELLGSRVQVISNGEGRAELAGMSAAEISEIAAAAGIVLHEVATRQASLEDAYLALTHNQLEFQTGLPQTAGAQQ